MWGTGVQGWLTPRTRIVWWALRRVSEHFSNHPQISHRIPSIGCFLYNDVFFPPPLETEEGKGKKKKKKNHSTTHKVTFLGHRKGMEGSTTVVQPLLLSKLLFHAGPHTSTEQSVIPMLRHPLFSHQKRLRST